MQRDLETLIDLDTDDATVLRRFVISGDHSPAFEAACDALAERIGAERAHVTGAKHTTPHAAAAFNTRHEAFMSAAERM